MAGIYRLNFLQRSDGVEYRRLINYLDLALVRKVNYPGVLQVSLAYDHPVFDSLAKGDMVELWRKDPQRGIAWYKEFGGFYQGNVCNWSDEDGGNYGKPYRILNVIGYNGILAERVVAWPAMTSGKSYFAGTVAESVAKYLTSYNLGTNATVENGRILNGVMTGFTNDTWQSQGEAVYQACAFKNVLETLQDLAANHGFDFNVVRTTGANWKFYWYLGQMGTDRTASLFFAIERGNMIQPVWTDSRVNEKTVAVVAGGGQEDARTFVVRYSDTYAADNHREIYVDARDVGEDTNLLNERGDQRLTQEKADNYFTFDVAQTETCLYGRDYFLGDLGTAINPYTGDTHTVKVDEIAITHDPSGEETLEIKVIET